MMDPPFLGLFMGGKFPPETGILDLAQAGDVICHGFDFAVIELGSHIAHLVVVATRAIAERIELLDRVVCMLA